MSTTADFVTTGALLPALPGSFRGRHNRHADHFGRDGTFSYVQTVQLMLSPAATWLDQGGSTTAIERSCELG